MAFAFVVKPLLAANGGEKVIYQQVIRDEVLPQRTWREAWKNPKQSQPGSSSAASAGALLRVYLESGDSRKIAAMALDGQPVEALHDQYDVPWYRVVTLRTSPTTLTKVEIRLGKVKPANRAYVLTLRFDDGLRQRVVLSNRRSPYALAHVAINADRDQLLGHIVRYTRGELPIQTAWLNGRDISDQLQIGGGGWYGNVMSFKLSLDHPLADGQPCVLRLGRGANAVGGDFRAYCRPFSIGMYGGSAASLARLGFNTKLDYHPKVSRKNLDALEDHGIMLLGRVMRHPDKHTQVQTRLIAEHPAIYAIYGYDEPDVKDYHLDNVPIDKRIGRTGMKVADQIKTFRKHQPTRLVYMVIDSTFKPMNYYTYGQMADITAVDPYPFTKRKSVDVTMKEAVGDVASIGRIASRPKPLFVTLGVHHFENGRMPTAEELRSQVYWALAEGTKGLNYFSWTFKRGKGFKDAPELHPMVEKLNALCARLGDRLNQMQPADTVIEHGEGVQGGVLHHPDGSLLIFVVSDDPGATLHEAMLKCVAPRRTDQPLKCELIDGAGTLDEGVAGNTLKLKVSADRSAAIIRVSAGAKANP